MLCLSGRIKVFCIFCTTRYWLLSLSNQGIAELWNTTGVQSSGNGFCLCLKSGGRLEFNCRTDWQVSDKESSFKRWECCPLWGISTQIYLPCATPQKHIGKAKIKNISIYSFLISADTDAALRNRREKIKHLQIAFFSYSSTLSFFFFFSLRDGVNISKFKKAGYFELILISQ